MGHKVLFFHSGTQEIKYGGRGLRLIIKLQGINDPQRFPVPVFSIPIPVLRLSSLETRFRFRFRDCPWLEHDSESGSETTQALNSIPIPVPRLHRLRTRFRFRVLTPVLVLIPDTFTLKKGFIWVKRALLEQNRGCN